MIDRIGPKNPSRVFIREWMEKKDIDGERLAERMDISPGTMSKLLNGRMKMTLEYLDGFADALGLDETALIFRHPDMPTRDELLAQASPEELRAAIHLIRTAKTGTDG